MAIVKLVCQGCGANLDAIDRGFGGSPVIQCGYCGTNNQIRQTFHPTPTPQPPPQPPQYAPPQVVAPPPEFPPRANTGSSNGLVWFMVIMVLIPMLISGVVFFLARSGIKSFEEFTQQIDGVLNKTTRQFYWTSGHPMVADVDGDQTDDVIGTIQEIGEQKLLLTAMSGSNYATLWEVELGRLTDLPDRNVYLEPRAKLVFIAMGPALHAYELQSGTQRWVATLPDKIATIAIDGDHLWVATIDNAASKVSLAAGKVSPTSPTPSASAKPLRDDGGYDLIPDIGQLDLAYDQFSGLRVAQAFCPIENLPLIVGSRWDDASKRCTHPHGLAFVTRDKGTAIPYLIGYDRATKAERWRVQLTSAGSLETVDTGFGQPRAEFLGDDEAIVSLVPSSDNNARIRRISLIDGSTKWETTLVRKNIENVDGISVGSNLVFVNYGQSLQILSLADGSLKTSLGGY